MRLVKWEVVVLCEQQHGEGKQQRWMDKYIASPFAMSSPASSISFGLLAFADEDDDDDDDDDNGAEALALRSGASFNCLPMSR